MKVLESRIFDVINFLLSKIQEKFDYVRQNSFLLSQIDYFILIFIILTYFVSLFASTNIIGLVSFFVPFLVVFKVLMTKGEKLELEKNNFFLLLYLVICVISCFSSSMISQSLYGLMKTMIYFAFYFALCQFLKSNKKYILILLFAIALLVSFESVIAIFQSIVKVESISTWQDTSYVNPEDVLSRVYGTLKPYNPNLFAGWLLAGMGSILGFAFIYLNKGKIKSTIISIVFFLISIFAVFQSGCRSAYLALFVAIICVIFASFYIVFYDLKIEKLKKIWKAILSVCVVSTILFMFFHSSILKRLLSIFLLRGDSSTSFRMNVYNSAIQMFQDNPIFGIGVGNKVFREIYGLYMLSGYDALSCYCVFLEMAVESGILSLIMYLCFLSVLLINAYKKFVSTNELNYKILVAITSFSIIAVLFHGFFDTVYFRPQVQYVFWTMVAILTVLVKDEKIENK